ncbi:MAG: hypothetical protein V2A75_00735 [Pseudomonadota bacterium]
MRSAMAMIELIFAIVIIAISVMTIPSMMNIADQASKRIAIDDDVMARLSGQMIDKFQARWGGEYVGIDNNESTPVFTSAITTMPDLNCSRIVGTQAFRANPDSSVECNLTQIPLAIPATTGAGADGNVSKGLEMLNSGTETLRVTSSTGETFDIYATYNVRYVPSVLTSLTGNTATATWRLGSSGAIDQDIDGSLTAKTHLKRVVVRFWNNSLGVDTTLTFFKSNKGSN